MAKASLKDLSYGHLGEPAYDREENTWAFGRRPGRRNVLQQLGSWSTSLPRSKQLDDGTTQEAPRHIYDFDQAARALARDYPELVPSKSLLSERAAVSKAVQSVTHTYDPAVGDLLAYGVVSSGRKDRSNSYRRIRRVAALATGESGNILRVVVLAEKRHGWDEDRSIYISGASIGDHLSGYWAEEAAPIQQLCFAQSESNSRFLAVRLRTRTTVFRPTLNRLPVAAKRSAHYDLPPSRVDVNPILSISMDQTGGTPHADVTFNPEYQRQFGLIDQKGNWSVWDIEGKGMLGTPFSAICTCRGTIAMSLNPDAEATKLQGPPVREDGWARMLWIGDVNTVLVCNRRRIQVYDVRYDTDTSMECSELVHPQSADWILDVKPHPTIRQHLFVLTSSRLFLMAVKCLGDTSTASSGEAGATVLLSWAHFRGLDDITLQLCLPAVAEGGIVMIQSRTNSLVSVFQFGTSDLGSAHPFSSSDPLDLIFKESPAASGGTSSHISALHMEPLLFVTHGSRQRTGLGFDYLSQDIPFYRLTAMLADLSVHEILLVVPPSSGDTEGQSLTKIEPPEWTTIVRVDLGLSSATRIDDSDDDFVVADGLDFQSGPRQRHNHATRGSKQSRLRRRESVDARQQHLGEDYSQVYKSLIPEFSSSRRQDGTLVVEDIADVIDHVEKVLSDRSDRADYANNILLSTILEQTGASITVQDIDASSAKLKEMLSADVESHIWLQKIATDAVLDLLDSPVSGHSVASVYDGILQNWIAPLPPEVPPRVRQAKERLARRIAAEVMLASTRIRQVQRSRVSENIPSSPPRDAVPSSSSLPTLPSSQPSVAWLKSSDSTFSQTQSQVALPTPEPTPSIASASSFLSSMSPTVNPVTGNLSKHLQINKPAPTISPNLNQVLMHWKEGSDPNDYDWEKTTDAVNEELGLVDRPSDAQRAKAQRKAQRHLKRQRREAELLKKAESQPIMRWDVPIRSSPGPAVRMDFSSQAQTQSQSHGFGGIALVQSQAEPGRHGARPVKKKPKRLGGF